MSVASILFLASQPGYGNVGADTLLTQARLAQAEARATPPAGTASTETGVYTGASSRTAFLASILNPVASRPVGLQHALTGGGAKTIYGSVLDTFA
ncbi:MAG: hypothetical protein P4M15_14055 [Alphaproteobacteria bacterium]|nr:hypothetical protein [Alphaproteobacteria bacterium]